jgi:hypothetical protein
MPDTLATFLARFQPPEQRKHEILVWALARRNQILKDGVTHG